MWALALALWLCPRLASWHSTQQLGTWTRWTGYLLLPCVLLCKSGTVMADLNPGLAHRRQRFCPGGSERSPP